MLPEGGELPKFSQIYYMDPDMQAARRNEVYNGELDEEKLTLIQHLLEENNPYVNVYKQAREMNVPSENVRIKISHKPTIDPRR